MPILATAGVDRVIREHDAEKEAQWRPTFKDEWPLKRTFPTRTVKDGERVVLGGATFTVHDLGSGESHSGSYWTVEGKQPILFVGDLVMSGVHAYLKRRPLGRMARQPRARLPADRPRGAHLPRARRPRRHGAVRGAGPVPGSVSCEGQGAGLGRRVALAGAEARSSRWRWSRWFRRAA